MNSGYPHNGDFILPRLVKILIFTCFNFSHAVKDPGVILVLY
jgi:hypothetical protein